MAIQKKQFCTWSYVKRTCIRPCTNLHIALLTNQLLQEGLMFRKTGSSSYSTILDNNLIYINNPCRGFLALIAIHLKFSLSDISVKLLISQASVITICCLSRSRSRTMSHKVECVSREKGASMRADNGVVDIK